MLCFLGGFRQEVLFISHANASRMLCQPLKCPTPHSPQLPENPKRVLYYECCKSVQETTSPSAARAGTKLGTLARRARSVPWMTARKCRLRFGQRQSECSKPSKSTVDEDFEDECNKQSVHHFLGNLDGGTRQHPRGPRSRPFHSARGAFQQLSMRFRPIKSVSRAMCRDLLPLLTKNPIATAWRWCEA